MFLMLLTLFTWMLLAAVVATLFPERTKLSLIVAAVLVVVALGTIAYSIAILLVDSKGIL